MAVRTWSLVLILLVSAALAGCTNSGDDGAEGGDGGNDGGNDAGNGGSNNGGGSSTSRPDNFLLEDSGSIQGPFSQTWTIEVENVAFSAATIHFELTSAQAGAPPAARINLVLADPEGAPLRTATLGLGGEGDSVTWDLTPADLPTAGSYTLTATSGSDAPLPSLGVAGYNLHATVSY